MINGSGLLSGGLASCSPMRMGADVDIGITGYIKYSFFGSDVWITNTHISILIVMIMIITFAIFANRAIRKADPNKVPGKFLNAVECMVETFDNMTISNMGEKYGRRFSSYIGTIFIYILFSNMSGLLGLRPPTADYGMTLALGLLTFMIIHYNGVKYEKVGHFTKLFKPVFLAPINIIGEIATPLSMSLRLFGNVLSGTVLMALIYALLPKVVLLVVPGFLHGYFDIFSGAIQTYVFCMLTMVFTSSVFPEEA